MLLIKLSGTFIFILTVGTPYCILKVYDKSKRYNQIVLKSKLCKLHPKAKSMRDGSETLVPIPRYRYPTVRVPGTTVWYHIINDTVPIPSNFKCGALLFNLIVLVMTSPVKPCFLSYKTSLFPSES